MSSPTKDVHFDGNPVDLDRVFAACALQFLLEPSSFRDSEGNELESVKTAYLLAKFRGPALDWAARRVDQDGALTSQSYADTCTAVKAYFGYDSTQAEAIARATLGQLTLQGDLLEFLVEFDGLCAKAGLASDTSKITLLIPKLKGRYRSVITDSGQLPTRYYTVRQMLTNAYAMDPGTAKTRRGEAQESPLQEMWQTRSHRVTV